jgi:hypothetical protein
MPPKIEFVFLEGRTLPLAYCGDEVEPVGNKEKGKISPIFPDGVNGSLWADETRHYWRRAERSWKDQGRNTQYRAR